MPDDARGYRVLKAPCSAEIREKGSRFLALVQPVGLSSEAKAFRKRLEREHRGASHHCWAQRIGWPPAERWSDSGEPRGTAGEPIVRVLRSRELSDVLAVVIRWFGGTKLGKGGLARAYSAAVAAALEPGRFEARHATSLIRFRTSYEKVGALKRLVRPGEVEWLEESYGAEVAGILRVRLDLEADVREALADLCIEARPGPEDHS